MVYHILNGDVLAEKFPAGELPGKFIVIREAFMDGPLSTNLEEAFWTLRANFIKEHFHATPEEYETQFISQLHLLDQITDEDEICLWFEDDLFCVINMLFVLYYLRDKTKAFRYRIFPVADKKYWTGFANIKPHEFKLLFDHRIPFNHDELILSYQLWESIVQHDDARLKTLSYSDTHCFRYLPDVIQAHIDRMAGIDEWNRPYRTLINILEQGKTNFYEIYEDFMLKEGIYGFGDVQVMKMLKELGVEEE